MKAVLIGATGSTGKFLLEELLQSSDYSEVVVFVRRTTGIIHSKLTEHIIDFSNILQYRHLVLGDVFFSCLGTTLKDAGTKDKQWEIDFTIPATFAKLAAENNIRRFVLLSASGANSRSLIFYSKMKGALEKEIEQHRFGQYIIFQPGLLERPNTERGGEKTALKALNFLNKWGFFKNYKPLPTSLLAKHMAAAPKKYPLGNTYIKLEEIFSI